ncbi:hypothetical protein OQA88_1197 [Cercophora sp. LCS_1]
MDDPTTIPLLEPENSAEDLLVLRNVVQRTANRGSGIIYARLLIAITSIVKDRPLNSAPHDRSCPSGFTPFYLYGTSSDPHMDHILVRSPNITLSAGGFSLSLDDGASVDSLLGCGAILSIDGQHEAAMQPFGDTNDDLPRDFFFGPGKDV